MNKTIRNTAMTLALVSLTASAVVVSQPAHAESALKAMFHLVTPTTLPPGVVVPNRLPTQIRDPHLLVAWIELYNHTEPITLWDGRTLTGRDLAQFVFDNEIPVVWDADNVCGGSSCSVLTCTDAGCVYAGQSPGVDPLYIRPTLQGDAVGTLNALAHEIFHRTQPFGVVADTKFEEYWAFRVGNLIAPKTWPVFDGYDPMVSGWLFLWLRDNGMGAYYSLADYPPVIEQRLASAE